MIYTDIHFRRGDTIQVERIDGQLEPYTFLETTWLVMAMQPSAFEEFRRTKILPLRYRHCVIGMKDAENVTPT